IAVIGIETRPRRFVAIDTEAGDRRDLVQRFDGYFLHWRDGALVRLRSPCLAQATQAGVVLRTGAPAHPAKNADFPHVITARLTRPRQGCRMCRSRLRRSSVLRAG